MVLKWLFGQMVTNISIAQLENFSVAIGNFWYVKLVLLGTKMFELVYDKYESRLNQKLSTY